MANERRLDTDWGIAVEHIRPLLRWDREKWDPVEFLREASEKARTLIAQGRVPACFAKPIGCQLELTARCNQRCLQCYNRSNDCRNVANELTRDQWLDVARQLVDAGVFEVILSGGEPLLLGSTLYDILDVLHEASIECVIITNGMLLIRAVFI